MKNIIFDLGGVLLKGKAASTLNNLEITDDTRERLKKFFENCENLDLGLESLQEKFTNCNFYGELAKYKDFLLSYYKYRKINTDLVKLIYKLKSNKHNIYILSDNNKEAYNYYKNNKDFKFVDGWVVSCEYGTCKKDGKLFDIFLEKFNLNPEDCYLVDDRKVNVEVAVERGIRCFVFDEKESIEKLCEDMKKNGIVI